MSSPKVLTPEEVALKRHKGEITDNFDLVLMCQAYEALRALGASTRRAALDEAIALVDASTFSDMGVGGGWLKGPKQIREELEQLRDTPPPKETP